MTFWLCQRSWLWWVNEIGILLEIIGAAIIVVAAFKSRAATKGVQDTWDADLVTKLRDIIAAQALTELKGFVLFALGLFGQMVGGFE